MNFREISLDDKPYIDSIFKKYPPYCDFSFLNLYNWRPNGRISQIAELNNNLVVKAGSLINDNLDISILGETNIKESIDELMSIFKALSIVPEVVVNNYPGISSVYNVTEDEDNRDYVISIEDTINLQGDKYNSKRNYINKFSKTPELRIILYKNPLPSTLPKEIEDLYKYWYENKFEKTVINDSEFMALNNLIDNANIYDLLYVFIYIENKLAAFSINELTAHGYAIANFAKTNISYTGISEFLMHNTAKILYTMGYKYMNYEQDLGIQSLRKYKMSWIPDHYLRKFNVKEKA